MSDSDKGYLSIVLGIVVPFSIFCIGLILFCLFRYFSRNNRRGYNQVDHDLDEEEIEFKRNIESQHGMSDDIDNLYSDDFSDLEGFDSKDLDHLSILEKYRTNLVASHINNSTPDSKNTTINNIDMIESDVELKLLKEPDDNLIEEKSNN